jgi:hypothetical protein
MPTRTDRTHPVTQIELILETRHVRFAIVIDGAVRIG